MTRLLSIVFLLLSSYVYGQGVGAKTPGEAWNKNDPTNTGAVGLASEFWFELKTDSDGANWTSKDPASKEIWFNNSGTVYTVTPNTTYPSNDQSHFDGTYLWATSIFGIPGFAFDEWFIIKAPSTGNLDVNLDISGNAFGTTTVSLQWYELNDSIGEISFTPYPVSAIDYKLSKFSGVEGTSLTFDLSSDLSYAENSRITKDYILIRIGINDETFAGGFINNYNIRVTTNNNICRNSLLAPLTTLAFSDTLNTGFKDLLDNSDEISVSDKNDFSKTDSLYGNDDLNLGSGSPGIWFRFSTEEDSVYLAACDSDADLQFLVFENNCPGVSVNDSIIAAENQNEDVSTPTPGRDVCISDPNNVDIPVVYFPTGASAGTPKDFYVYLFGNSSEDLFDFYFLTPDLMGFGDILPVEWLTFKGETISNQNKLIWSTASEKDNDYFIIEKSADGENYTELGRVQGKGNSFFESAYTFRDIYPYYQSYYRLKQVDFNGKVNAGPETLVQNESISFQWSIPNVPVNNGIVTLIINSSEKRNATVTIYASDGKKMMEKDMTLNENKDLISIDVGHLNSGLYHISIEADGLTTSKKILIQSSN